MKILYKYLYIEYKYRVKLGFYRFIVRIEVVCFESFVYVFIDII